MRIDFFHQAHLNNWDRYLASLKNKQSGVAWDLVVLTSSNEKQAEAYEYQLATRKKLGMLPRQTEFRVIADPQGVRIGSGGATLNVLVNAGQVQPPGAVSDNPFAGRRILILHSGGDSKRLPQYSAFGKIFSPIPRLLDSGRPSTLFDELFVALSGIPPLMSPGIVIASGDVLLLFDHSQLDVSRPGFTGVAIRADKDMASHHGVFVADPRGSVRRFMHKPSIDAMVKNGALDGSGSAPVDTGIIYFGANTANRFYQRATGDDGWLARAVNEGISVNFYGDFLLPLAPEMTCDEYLEDTSDGPATPQLKALRQEIWQELRGIPFYVSVLEPAKFLHFGTTREYQRLITYDDQDIQALGGCRRVSHFWHRTARIEERACILHSSIGEDCRVAAGATIEFSALCPGVEVEKDAVISNATVPAGTLVPAGTVIHGLPLRHHGRQGFSVRIWGVDDNPKAWVPTATLMGHPLAEWLPKLGLSEAETWPGIESATDKTLWHARIFPVMPTEGQAWQAVADILAVAKHWSGDHPAANFSRLDRMSLAESSDLADLEAIGTLHQNLFMDMVCAKCLLFFENETCVADWREKIPTSVDMQALLNRFGSKAVQDAPSLENARFCYSIASLMNDSDLLSGGKTRAELENLAFSQIRACMLKTRAEHKCAMSVNAWRQSEVNVHLPVRIDFAGGWSDTPPYTLEKGGCVLNASLSINGKLPITVTARRLAEPVVILESGDLDVHATLADWADLQDFSNPHDPLALHKAAVSFVLGGHGLGDPPLARCLDKLGGGLFLTSKVHLPKGTGLGTSSILAAALVQGILDLGSQAGTCQYPVRLFTAASAIEQMLTTGGGWQDQVGGLVPGIKLTTAKPGCIQNLSVQDVDMPPALRRELDERLVILDTGQRRLAKNLLRDIMGSWLRRERRTVRILADIQSLAREGADALRYGDFFSLGHILWRHWELNKQLDAGTTNPLIDSLMEALRPYLEGAKLAGAGGGGFLMGIAKLGGKEKIQALIASDFADTNIRYYDSRIEW